VWAHGDTWKSTWTAAIKPRNFPPGDNNNNNSLGHPTLNAYVGLILVSGKWKWLSGVKKTHSFPCRNFCIHLDSHQENENYNKGQDRTGQDRTGQDRTGQDRTGQVRTGKDRTGQDRTGQDRTGQVRTGQDRTGKDRTGQDRTGPDRTRQDKTGQDRTGAFHVTLYKLILQILIKGDFEFSLLEYRGLLLRVYLWTAYAVNWVSNFVRESVSQLVSPSQRKRTNFIIRIVNNSKRKSK
jgi:hypothetical protein